MDRVPLFYAIEYCEGTWGHTDFFYLVCDLLFLSEYLKEQLSLKVTNLTRMYLNIVHLVLLFLGNRGNVIKGIYIFFKLLTFLQMWSEFLLSVCLSEQGSILNSLAFEFSNPFYHIYFFSGNSLHWNFMFNQSTLKPS